MNEMDYQINTERYDWQRTGGIPTKGKGTA